MIEQQISCGIHVYIICQKPVFFKRLLCLFLTRKSDDSVFTAIAKRIHQVGLLGVHTSCHLDDPFTFSSVFQHFLVVRQFSQRGQKSLHTPHPALLLFLFLLSVVFIHCALDITGDDHLHCPDRIVVSLIHQDLLRL